HLTGISRAEEFVQQAVASSELFPQSVALLFQGQNFGPAMLGFAKQSFVAVRGWRGGLLVRNVRPGLLQEFVEECVHGLLAVRIARIVAQQNVMLHEEEIVL